jgi:endonuclease YncB( thermonuclease family)
MQRRTFLGLSATLLGRPAQAARRDPAMTALLALSEAQRGIVAGVTDSATLSLQDGIGVRLAGIEPVLATPGGTEHWEDAARALLGLLALERTVSLRGAAAGLDRYGRVVAQAVRDDGLWLQGMLLEAGAARVQPPVAWTLSAAMLRREAAARRHRYGIWQSPRYAVRKPGELQHEGGGFVVVEALIAKAEDRHGTFWLDLGDAAAARIDRPARQRFQAAGLDPRLFAGARLRLRGWVAWQGRPVLQLEYPEAVEALPPRRRAPW